MNKQEELAIMLGQTIFNNTIKGLQSKIDEQAEEIAKLKTEVDVQTYWGKRWEDENKLRVAQAEKLAKLREFAKYVLIDSDDKYDVYAEKIGLFDVNGKPTTLLTGDEK